MVHSLYAICIIFLLASLPTSFAAAPNTVDPLEDLADCAGVNRPVAFDGPLEVTFGVGGTHEGIMATEEAKSWGYFTEGDPPGGAASGELHWYLMTGFTREAVKCGPVLHQINQASETTASDAASFVSLFVLRVKETWPEASSATLGDIEDALLANAPDPAG